MDHEAEDVEQETVAHVEDASQLGENQPHQAEPPELQRGEERAQQVAAATREQVAQDILQGVACRNTGAQFTQRQCVGMRKWNVFP